MASADPQAVARYLLQLRTFVTGADDLVGLIERENARKTAWLRTSQMALAAMACIGTAAIVYLLFLWIVVPVQRLQDGLARIEAREFDARLPVETQDEFGHLAAGFNRMAAELQTLYRDLAGRVEAKTAELAAQNRELTALYEMAAFVNQPNDVDALCRGFLARLMRQFDADGAAVRLFTEDGQVRLIGSEGLPAALLQDESCFAADACACAQRSCQRAGFASVAAFSIVSQGEARRLLAALRRRADYSRNRSALARNTRHALRHSAQEPTACGIGAAACGVGGAKSRCAGLA